MNTEFTFSELLGRGDTRQFVVPELQRDYVWERKNWQAVATQLLDSYRAYLVPAALPKEMPEEMLSDFMAFHRKKHLGYNLGFLYAYTDPAYSGHCFLIDGQQRLTTLLLLLLGAAKQGGQTDHFRRHYLTGGGEQPCLAYRVRETAQEFMIQFVAHVLSGQPLAHLDATTSNRPYWFFGHYRHDATVQQLLTNYNGIAEWLEDTFPAGVAAAADGAESAAGFYDYLHGAVRFWYFDTNKSAQGEELYLSLNASGEPLTGSENLKAYLLADLPAAEKNEWGQEFERWEQFFWEYRDHHAYPARDAGPGLDDFFRWVAVCEILRRSPSEDKAATTTATELLRRSSAAHIREALTGKVPASDRAAAARDRLENIGQYVAALRFLYDAWRPQAQAQAVAHWQMKPAAVDQLLPELAWLHPTLDEPLQAQDALRLLPVLAYLRMRGEAERDTTVDGVALFRVVRYFYNLSRVATATKNPFDSGVSAVRLGFALGNRSADVAGLTDLPPALYALDTEPAKLLLFRKLTSDRSREQAELLCWQLEDEHYNQGEIKHLCADLTALTLPELQVLAEKYKVLFGGSTSLKQLQTLLLDYGRYQLRSSNNSYYESYYFADWRSTVRSLAFKCLLDDMPTVSASIPALYEERKQKLLASLTPETMSGLEGLGRQLFLLSILFDTMLKPTESEKGCAIWQAGDYAGWYHYTDSTTKTLFTDGHNLLNSRGGFGYQKSNTTELFATLQSNRAKARMSFKRMVAEAFGNAK